MTKLATQGLVFAIASTYFAGVAVHAYRTAPVSDEYGHFAAGLAWWQFGNTDLFRVNPPTIRILATAPAFAAGMRLPGSLDRANSDVRPEFMAGRELFAANPERFQMGLFYGRLLIGLFNTLGVLLCYVIVSKIASPSAGVFAMLLWAGQPQLLAHGATIINDIPAAIGILAVVFLMSSLKGTRSFYEPFLLGIALGAATTLKFTALVLWPLVVLHWTVQCIHQCTHRCTYQCALRCTHRWRSNSNACNKPQASTNFLMLFVRIGLTFSIACLVIGIPYGFHDIGKSLDSFSFVSTTFGGTTATIFRPSNRFGIGALGQVFGSIRVPFPADFVQGIDRQQYDFERGLQSYAAGIRSMRGWWWFYPYSMLVKLPIGTLAILLTMGMISFYKLVSSQRMAKYELPWQLPACLALLAWMLVSRTGFAQQHRYVFAIYPMLFVLAGIFFDHSNLVTKRILIGFLFVTWIGMLSVAPNWMSSYNIIAGGYRDGPWHIANDASEWGQDLYVARDWAYDWRKKNPLIEPILVSTNAKISSDALGIPSLSANELKESLEESSNSKVWIVSTTDLAFVEEIEILLRNHQIIDRIYGSYVIFASK